MTPNKGLMSKTMTPHGRYKSWYISWPSSANNNVKESNSAYFGECEPQWLSFSYFYLELNRTLHIQLELVSKPIDKQNRSR